MWVTGARERKPEFVVGGGMVKMLLLLLVVDIVLFG